MKIEITPRHFAELIHDMSMIVSVAREACENCPEDVERIDSLLSEISDRLEELEVATSDVRSALSYLAQCMQEY